MVINNHDSSSRREHEFVFSDLATTWIFLPWLKRSESMHIYVPLISDVQSTAAVLVAKRRRRASCLVQASVAGNQMLLQISSDRHYTAAESQPTGRVLLHSGQSNTQGYLQIVIFTVRLIFYQSYRIQILIRFCIPKRTVAAFMSLVTCLILFCRIDDGFTLYFGRDGGGEPVDGVNVVWVMLNEYERVMSMGYD